MKLRLHDLLVKNAGIIIRGKPFRAEVKVMN